MTSWHSTTPLQWLQPSPADFNVLWRITLALSHLHNPRWGAFDSSPDRNLNGIAGSTNCAIDTCPPANTAVFASAYASASTSAATTGADDDDAANAVAGDGTRQTITGDANGDSTLKYSECAVFSHSPSLCR